jgi:toxin ParE1/3/4
VSSFKLTPRAQRDFDEIWDYSKGKWGARRALTYLRQIRTAIALIAGYPDLGPLFEDIPGGYRKRAVGSHVIFYRQLSQKTEIVRILHQNMDVDSHLL